MIVEREGDLLNSGCNVILHQCNCQSVMGSGIARQIRERYPGAYDAFKNDTRSPEDKLGKLSMYIELLDDFCVINAYGQLHFGSDGRQYTSYDALSSAVDLAMKTVTVDIRHFFDVKNLRVGVPYLMGCGLGGGKWETVYGVLDRVARKYNQEIEIWKI